MPHTELPDGRVIGKAIPVIENYWDWQLAYNFGSAFSMFDGKRTFLTIVGLIAMAGVFWMIKTAKNHQTMLATALGLICGGAIGNLYDRIALGKVTDFVVWRYHEHAWPTFNIADVALCVGLGLIILDSILHKNQPDT